MIQCSPHCQINFSFEFTELYKIDAHELQINRFQRQYKQQPRSKCFVSMMIKLKHVQCDCAIRKRTNRKFQNIRDTKQQPQQTEDMIKTGSIQVCECNMDPVK